jgi:uncharacterized protein YkwD
MTVRRFSLLIIIMVIIGLAITLSPARAQENRDLIALEVIARLNEWRMKQGLSPLNRHPTLDAMALYHARYLSGLRSIPDGAAIHRNAQGHGVLERARYEEFNWENYGSPARTVVGEIAAVMTVDNALAFWEQSSVHHRTVINPAYREVGVAVISQRFGRYIIVVVFGSRPNVLPAMVSPVDGSLYLTNERYTFAAGSDDAILNADRVRLFDTEGRPIGNWTDWQSKLPVPPEASDLVSVLYWDTARDIQALSIVTQPEDRVWLPGYVPTATATPTPTLTPTQTFTPTPVISPTPSPTPTLTLTPTNTPIPPPEILLIYDDRSLILLNQSTRSLDVYRLSFSGSGTTLDGSWWQNVMTVQQLVIFQPGSCLQAWSFEAQTSPPPRPPECRSHIGVRGNLAASSRFWLQGSFEVRHQGQLITTCPSGPGRCEVDLP